MHCHTLHSDGKFTVESLMQTAKEYGLSGIALTDHNTVSGWDEITEEREKKYVSVLKGIEWTTFFRPYACHRLQGICGLARRRSRQHRRKKIAEVKKRGGMVGIAHPYELGSPMCTGCFWDYQEKNGKMWTISRYGRSRFRRQNRQTSAPFSLWTGLLDKGYHLAATYGKDWHKKSDETEPYGCTYRRRKRNAHRCGNKKAVQNGRTSITMGPLITLTAQRSDAEYNVGDVLEEGKAKIKIEVFPNTRKEHWEKFNITLESVRLIRNGCQTVFESKYGGDALSFTLNCEPGWYIAELWGKINGQRYMIGFTSPMYFTVKK